MPQKYLFATHRVQPTLIEVERGVVDEESWKPKVFDKEGKQIPKP